MAGCEAAFNRVNPVKIGRKDLIKSYLTGRHLTSLGAEALAKAEILSLLHLLQKSPKNRTHLFGFNKILP
jgi:hypothetical protein